MPHQFPVSLPRVVDLAIGAIRTNILEGVPQRVVKAPSRVDVALSREGVDVTYGIEIGGTIAIPDGSPCNIVAAVGSLPRFDQDGVGTFGADAGDEIAIFGSNVNAAAQELRAQIRITALEDLELIQGGPQG